MTDNRAICFVEPGFTPPEVLLRDIRRKIFGLCINRPNPIPLTQLGDDIWYTTDSIAAHSDKQPDGFVTTGWVLINDQNAKLFDNAGEFDFPSGSVYRLWGKETHGTRSNRSGIFAALVWDGPFLDAGSAKEFVLQAAFEMGARL